MIEASGKETSGIGRDAPLGGRFPQEVSFTLVGLKEDQLLLPLPEIEQLNPQGSPS
jgi:hypothetical protein